MTAPLVGEPVRLWTGNRRLARALAGFGAALLLAPPVVLFALARQGSRGQITELCLALLAAGVACFVGRRFALRGGGGVFAEIDVDPSGVTVRSGGSTRVVPTEDIDSAVVVPSRRCAVQVVEKRGATTTVFVDSIEEGERILDAAGLSAAARRSRHDLATARSWIIPGAILFFVPVVVATLVAVPLGLYFGEVNAATAATWEIVAAAVAIAISRRFGPPRVVVGADGVWIEQGKRSRFLKLGDIVCAEIKFGGLRLELNHGEVVWAAGVELDRRALAAARLRIEEAMRAAASPHEGASATTLLERRGRAIDAWRAEVATLVTGACGGYRRLGVTVDDAVAVVSSASASAEQRIGAALALAAASDQGVAELRPRVRIAAAACASPHLRVALESIAEGEGDAAAIQDALAAESTS
ncbi:MAG TPA: PH domain-containing protein [Byssovorax sp.]|jgi:hypothetical protein